MIIIYIGAAIVVLGLLLIAVLAIIWVSNTISASIRAKTIDVISQYNELIDLKSEKLHILQNEIELLEKKKAQLRSNSAANDNGDDSNSTNAVTTSNSVLNIVSSVGATEYSSTHTANTYRQIRQFKTNIDKVVASIPAQYRVVKPNRYEALLNKLSIDVIYQLSTLSSNEQYVVLRQCLEEKDYKVLEDYYQTQKKFSVVGFYDYLKNMAITKSNNITLIVPEDTKFSTIVRGIDIRTDKSILEGYLLEKENVMYDFSIKDKEIY